MEAYLSTRTELIVDGWHEGADCLLADALSSSIRSISGEVPPGVALAALGGFGRGSMAIYSDVDLLFLHRGSQPTSLVQNVLHPLWDAHLKVGHLTNTPKGAISLARVRLHALSTMLTSKFLNGDEELFAEFRRRLHRLIDSEFPRIRSALLEEELARRHAEPYLRMAADLKTDRGGVRSLDLVDWRRRMLDASGLEEEPSSEEMELRSSITRIRSALHVSAGRVHDRFDFELRAAAAGWCDQDITSLARDFTSTRRAIDRLVDRVWLHSDATQRVLPVAIESTRPIVRAAAPAGAVDAVLERLVPEWPRLSCEPHIVPFHAFGVADHTLAAVDIGWSMVDGHADDLVAQEILHGLDDPKPLVWALLLHDVAKGLGGDHARRGAEMVPGILKDQDLNRSDCALIERLVDTHLVLADLATRHDIGDRAVLAWALERIGDTRTLRFLYLVTVADSQATGTDTWSPWRAELLRRAYRSLERAFIRESMPDDLGVQVVTDEVVAFAPGISREAVVAHLLGLDRQYRRINSPETIAEHVEISRERLGPGGGVIRSTSGEPARVTIVADDRPRLLLGVAGVLAIHRTSIVDARLATRSDARVFDVFDVVDPGTDRLERIVDDLRRLLRGGFDVGTRLAHQRHAYRLDRLTGFSSVVRVARRGAGDGVIDVECADRLGLLYDLAEVLDQLGIPVVRARVDTRGRVAYDTFYVTRLPADTTNLERRVAEVADRV